MRTGSTIENAFEYAIQATLGISQFYLSRNCSVGVSFYNCHGEILPESGKRQSFRIARQLITVETVAARCGTDRQVALAEAVESIRSHLHGFNPFFIVVTMIGKDNAADLIGGIRAMWKYSPGGARPQIMVLHVQGYALAPAGESEKPGAMLMDMETAPLVRLVRRAGAFVVPWNPGTRSLMKVLAVGVKKRRRGH
jgi:uncharacterized protein (DUF58 family)